MYTFLYILSQLKRRGVRTISNILYLADQSHLLLYGRTITRDKHIATKNGPVLSGILDLIKGSGREERLKNLMKYFSIEETSVVLKKKPDMDFLSKTDVKCLNQAIAKCRNLTLEEEMKISCGFAWSNTEIGHPIAIKDILLEAGADVDFAKREQDRIHSETAFCERLSKKY